MSRTIDFDAFRAERAKDPILLTIGGKQYELPPSMPASLALDVMKMRETLGGDAEPSIDDLLKFGGALFGGRDKFQTVLEESGLELSELPDLVQMVVEAYTSGAPGNPATQA